jgi:2-polyprenyl-6-methoxyphenol hydroxylase-like FAD-dependent oxidoreductase
VVEDAHVVDLARDGAAPSRGWSCAARSTAGRTLRAPLVVGADGLRSVVGGGSA